MKPSSEEQQFCLQASVFRMMRRRWQSLWLAFALVGVVLITVVQAQTTVTTVVAAVSGNPSGLTFDAAGNLYVAIYNTNTVSKVTPTGTVTTFVSGFNTPFGLTIDAVGNLYVTNFNTNTVSKVTPTGTVTTFASGFSGPKVITIDAAGNLYVVNYNTNTVSKVTPTGTVTTFVSGFNTPFGLTIDAVGNLYVTNFDYDVGAVRRVTSAPTASNSLFRLVGVFPEKRHSSVAAVIRSQLLVSGGANGVSSLATGFVSGNDGAVGSWSTIASDAVVSFGARMVSFQLGFHSVSSLVVTGGSNGPNVGLDSTRYLLDGGAAAGTVFQSLTPLVTFSPARWYHGFVSAQAASSSAQRLYVFGGATNSATQGVGLLNDVWSADSSVSSWALVTTAPWYPRHSFAFATIRSRVILAGGYCSFSPAQTCNDAWISNIGLSSWTPLPVPPFSARASFSMVNINSNMYIFGGQNQAAGQLNDVWVSPDMGMSWMLVTDAAGFSPRSLYSAVAHDNTVLITGGRLDQGLTSNEVWLANL